VKEIDNKIKEKTIESSLHIGDGNYISFSGHGIDVRKYWRTPDSTITSTKREDISTRRTTYKELELED